MGRVIGILVVILVLFAIISEPQNSASTVRSGVSTLGEAATSVTVFLSAIITDISVSSSSSSSSSSSGIGDPVSDDSYPRGGVDTGDGSTGR